MPMIRRARTAQFLLVSEFVFNYNDVMANVASLTGASVELNLKAPVTDFGYGPTAIAGGLVNGVYVPPAFSPLLSGVNYNPNPNTGSTYFEILSLGVNSQIVGGEIQIERPYVGPTTATLSLGDVNSGALYLNNQSLLPTALGGTGYASGAHSGNTVTLTVGAGHGVVAGNLINVVNVTGAGAAVYNGTYLVDSVTATTIVYTSYNGTTDAANTAAAGTPTVTYTVGRVPLFIPGEETNQGGYTYAINQGYDAAQGYDIRATLTFSGGQAATQGRVRCRFWYTIDGRANEAKTT